MLCIISLLTLESMKRSLHFLWRIFCQIYAKFIRFAFTKSVYKLYQCKFHGIAGYACLILEKVAHSREWKHWKSENAFVAFIKCAPAQHIAIKLSFQELIFESITETFAREIHRNMKYIYITVQTDLT